MQETETFVVNEKDFVDVDEFTYMGVCKEGSVMKTVQSRRRVCQTKKRFGVPWHFEENKAKAVKDTGVTSSVIEMCDVEKDRR